MRITTAALDRNARGARLCGQAKQGSRTAGAMVMLPSQVNAPETSRHRSLRIFHGLRYLNVAARAEEFSALMRCCWAETTESSPADTRGNSSATPASIRSRQV